MNRQDQARDAWMAGNVEANGHGEKSEIAYFARQAFQAGCGVGNDNSVLDILEDMLKFTKSMIRSQPCRCGMDDGGLKRCRRCLLLER